MATYALLSCRSLGGNLCGRAYIVRTENVQVPVVLEVFAGSLKECTRCSRDSACVVVVGSPFDADDAAIERTAADMFGQVAHVLAEAAIFRSVQEERSRRAVLN